MNKDRVAVSIKGILIIDNKILLRKNERNEYELPGGKIKDTDSSVFETLKREFIEEAGIYVEITDLRNPWLYIVGPRRILIVPFLCSFVNELNETMLFEKNNICLVELRHLPYINIPQGYIDSISGRIPTTCFSPVNNDYFALLCNCVDIKFEIRIVIVEWGSLFPVQEIFLDNDYSPIEYIVNKLENVSAEDFIPINVNFLNGCFTIIYQYK